VEVLSSRFILRAVDFPRSRRFYEEVIGLSVYREYGTGGTVTGVVYFLGGGFLELTAGGEARAVDHTIWLQVPDVFAESTRLRDAGVTIRKSCARMPWGLIECWIEDPDGFELRLVEVPDDHPIRRRVEYE
jgi:predicted enzyme related to lactoylglutathione lyase